MKHNIKDVITFLKPEFTHQDYRGSLRQLVSEGWKQINVNSCLPGTIRGGHHHKKIVKLFLLLAVNLI